MGANVRYVEKAPAVRRINLAWYSNLAQTLKPLSVSLLSSGDDDDAWSWEKLYELHDAASALEFLLEQDRCALQLKVSREAMRRLHDLLIEVVRAKNPGEIYKEKKYLISHWAGRLAPLLQGELAVQNAYVVAPKRAYDVDVLVEDAAKLFSDDVRRSLAPIERYDIVQVGRCLAFEVPTAALFHIFRAADSVLRRYYKSITGVEPKARHRNWGAYIKNLRACYANEKIVSALEQMKDLHRNPIIHPDTEATIEEALSYVGIAESVISAMVSEINARPLAPLVVPPELALPAPTYGEDDSLFD